MNIQSLTLCKLAMAGAMYDSLTPFNKSLGRLNEDTGNNLDLLNGEHRLSLLKWLNAWGCRNLSKGQHEVASDSILSWYQEEGPGLFSDDEPIWYLGDSELKTAALAYGSLKDKPGAWRLRGGTNNEVHFGPTAASKVLFAIRPQALMPWDEAMRAGFGCDGTPKSYFRFLIKIRSITLHIADLCKNKGFQIEELPGKLGRPDSTVLALVNEYIWVTETREVVLPSSEIMAQWAELG